MLSQRKGKSVRLFFFGKEIEIQFNVSVIMVSPKRCVNMCVFYVSSPLFSPYWFKTIVFLRTFMYLFVNRVTAVDGQYQIGIYSTRPIAYGEEVTFDYNSVTEVSF